MYSKYTVQSEYEQKLVFQKQQVITMNSYSWTGVLSTKTCKIMEVLNMDTLVLCLVEQVFDEGLCSKSVRLDILDHMVVFSDDTRGEEVLVQRIHQVL